MSNSLFDAFKRAGFGVVDPKEDVRTMPLWLMRGYRPLEGGLPVPVQGARLWHQSQVRLLTVEERGGIQAELDVASNVIQLAIPKTPALKAGNRR
jgi:hypothetical protein